MLRSLSKQPDYNSLCFCTRSLNSLTKKSLHDIYADFACRFYIMCLHCDECLHDCRRVTIENVPCGADGVACTKIVNLELHDTRFLLVRGSPVVTTKIDGVTVKADYEIVKAGSYTYIKTKSGRLAEAMGS